MMPLIGMPAKLGPLGLGWKRSQQADRLMDVQIARMVKFHSILTRAMLGVPARSLVGQIQCRPSSFLRSKTKFLLVPHDFEDGIMIAFVMVALGRCGTGPVRRRSWLGLGGVVTVVAAGLAAYGFNSGLGERRNRE